MVEKMASYLVGYASVPFLIHVKDSLEELRKQANALSDSGARHFCTVSIEIVEKEIDKRGFRTET